MAMTIYIIMAAGMFNVPGGSSKRSKACMFLIALASPSGPRFQISALALRS